MLTLTITPLMYAGAIICAIFSVVNFLILTYLVIHHVATKMSTHTLEYRDPFSNTTIEDFQVEDSDKKDEEEKEESQNIDGLNKFIKDNEVII